MIALMENIPVKSRVNTVQAKNNLNALLAQIESGKKPIIIEKRGEPVAVLLDYETYQEGRGEDPVSAARTAYEELYADHLARKGTQSPGEDSAELIRQAREERIRRLMGDD